ncbi:glyoxylate/hydroxypyruvate reductase A [Pseudorhodoferax sp. Leaf265]|uniref:2-hydroxyacid dehydrogenase n=1 Tax=Pseudorhodoferax sp. Leaf265 TaxID=1736315 RepID=UPI0006F1D86E|nr:glyoxylate/hydroxypyruvate reductase A [Pseudorhodoferax sp. Leaf265]KQP02925.1 glyoxylate/hydroxypyruvate reductase A [Pseudorhodoferax sp. Leaf265]PZP97834.1 MAG: glyoxylate/hydroxypyruvate reductase A [Variovorax paradoxus]PZQ09128.1 MAG: glyoxylate/hydroxypyruvate reductase A [Variovorax paradoxus]
MRITVCLPEKPEPWVHGLQQALPEAEVLAWEPGQPAADYAVVWAPPQSFIDAQPKLRGLFNIGAGVDALMQLRIPAGTRIVRLDDAGMSVQMAEYVCHALIRHFREFDVYEAEARAGRWVYRKPRERADFPVGILGLGVLGERVAKAVAQFEFPVLGWSRSRKEIEGVRTFAGEARLGDFLVGTRVLVNLLPLTDATRGILNKTTLSALQPGGYLINIARGGHLVEDDLIPLLDSGKLAGATLDVFETEPLPAAHPFWQHPKISITPHGSARTLRRESIAQIAGKITALARGEAVAGVVDPERGY